MKGLYLTQILKSSLDEKTRDCCPKTEVCSISQEALTLMFDGDL